MKKISGIFETLMQVAARVMEKMGAYCSDFFVLPVIVNIDRDWHEKFVGLYYFPKSSQAG